MPIETVEVRLEAKGKIVGKTISRIQKEHGIKVLQLENFCDRAFPYSWEHPSHNRIVKEEDLLTIQGKQNIVKKFCEELN